LRVEGCCIASVDEAHLAIDAGAAALGLVSAMPSGPGPIDEALIAEIAAALPHVGVATGRCSGR
jgi:phosphoribosylanthranilate isomerase